MGLYRKEKVDRYILDEELTAIDSDNFSINALEAIIDYYDNLYIDTELSPHTIAETFEEFESSIDWYRKIYGESELQYEKEQYQKKIGLPDGKNFDKAFKEHCRIIMNKQGVEYKELPYGKILTIGD